MGGVSLLTEAWKAGLTVTVEGGRLHIRGPRRAYAIVQKLIAHKDAVLKALSVRPENLPRSGENVGQSEPRSWNTTVVCTTIKQTPRHSTTFSGK
jgi:hypothetical protein